MNYLQNLILTIIFFSCVNESIAQPNLMVRYGYEGRNEVYANALFHDSYLLAGNIRADIGLQDNFVMMVDSIGNVQWSKKYDIGINEHLTSVLVKDSTIFITGIGNSNMGFILKMTAGGDLINAYRYFNSPAIRFARAILVDDHIYISGIVWTDISTDPFVAKIDLNGTLIWGKQYHGGDGGESVYDIESTMDGGFLLTGNSSAFGIDGDIFLLKINSEGNHLWTRHYGNGVLSNAYDVEETSDSHILISSRLKLGSHFQTGIFKLNAIGDTIWTKAYGTPDYGHSSAPKILEISDGNYLIKTSVVIGPDEYPVHIKIDQNGEILWERNYLGPADYNSHELITETADGGFFTSTSFFNEGYEDFGFIKTDSLGLGVCTLDLVEIETFASGITSYGSITFVDSAITFPGSPSPNELDVEVTKHIICCDSVDAFFTYEVVDGVYHFSANETAPADFEWVIGSDTISGSSATYTFVQGGSIEVCLYVSNFCNSDSSCITIEAQVGGFTALTDILNYRISPNPFNTNLLIQILGSNAQFSFMIYNQAGQLIYQEDTQSNYFNVNMESFDRGIYLLQLTSSSGEPLIKKIVKL